MNWLLKTCNKPQIIIDGEELFTRAEEALLLISEKSYQRQNELQNFSFDIKKLQQDLLQLNYFNTNSVIQAINSNDVELINKEYFTFYNWFNKLQNDQKQPNFDTYFEVIKILRSVIGKIDSSIQYTQDEALKDSNEFKTETLEYMKRISEIVKSAIERIDTWSTPLVVIEPREGYDQSGYENWFQGSDNAGVNLGNDLEAPSFTFFFLENDKIQIDDVIDGDEDFGTIQRKQDYFNLVKELMKPGSTQQGKYLRLYTARPAKDRSMYLNATTVPVNIFLTNDFNHAEGLAIDLAGTNNKRDIWKIVINEKHLIQTLDGPIKYYQVVGKDFVPVKSIELISASD